MKPKILLVLTLIACALLSSCKYIVLPEGVESPKLSQNNQETKAWFAYATRIDQTASGDLRIDITIRNDTGEWSTMRAVENKPAVLTSGGKSTNCETVFIGTGGHRFAPGFQMRGYTTGLKSAPETQLLYVECKGAQAEAGAKLIIDYLSFQGELDDYKPEDNRISGKLELNLDEVVSDLTYPVAELVEGLVLQPGGGITGLSDNVVTLLDTQRTETGLLFTWQNFNPTKFPLKTHIGTPPVIGADGIIYGLYETIDLADVPLTPPNATAEWETKVSVPQDVEGFYILLSVESKKPRTYLNYVLDISDR
jgi:hypothetical protein